MNCATSSLFTFSADELERVFPFYVLFDAADTIAAVGRSMRKLAPAAQPGARFSEHFAPKRPDEPFDFARLVAQAGRHHALRARECGTLLCGQFQPQGDRLLFLGSPWIAESGDLAGLGLTLDDFAGHDPTLELLELGQVQKVVADDLQGLAREIAAQKLQLEAAARMKDAFLASLSHELRTPLTGVLGLTDTLIEQAFGPLNDKQVRFLHLVRGSAERLLALINDLLDLSRLGAGQHELVREPCTAGELCSAALERVKPAAAGRRQRVTFADEAPGARLVVDRRRLVQILVNLLDNASKFSPAGGEIGLRVSREDRDVRFSVWDRGIGIAADDVPLLFQPFVQIDGRLTRRSSGTGLGLALVEKLAALHGGRVGVQSRLGEGSEFWVVVPAADAPA